MGLISLTHGAPRAFGTELRKNTISDYEGNIITAQLDMKNIVLRFPGLKRSLLMTMRRSLQLEIE